MMFAKALSVATVLSVSSAFTPPVHSPVVSRVVMTAEPSNSPPPKPDPMKKMNGWKYQQNKFVGGLPGCIAPLGEFDPLELCYPAEMSESDVKRLREAEVMHGRVAMMAFVGWIMGEAVTPLTGKSFIMPTQVSGPATMHLAQIIAQQPLAFAVFVLAIGAAEIRRAQVGWVSPDEALFTLRDDYYPGDIGFDPLGFKPDTPEAFVEEQNRELSNGRLAMIAVAGMCAQEYMVPVQILENLGIQREILS